MGKLKVKGLNRNVETINLVSLKDLTKTFKTTKPSLIYYTQMGLLIPDLIIGQMAIFNEEKAVKRWNRIKTLRKKYTLSQIRDVLSRENDY